MLGARGRGVLRISSDGGRSKAFWGFEIFDSGICLGRNVWPVFFVLIFLGQCPRSSVNKPNPVREFFWGLISRPGIFSGFGFLHPFDHPRHLKSGQPPSFPTQGHNPSPESTQSPPPWGGGGLGALDLKDLEVMGSWLLFLQYNLGSHFPKKNTKSKLEGINLTTLIPPSLGHTVLNISPMPHKCNLIGDYYFYFLVKS